MLLSSRPMTVQPMKAAGQSQAKPTAARAGAQEAVVAAAGTAQPSLSQRPSFRFGLLSDVQYANIDDGASFHGVPRYYRNALVHLDRAVQTFLDQPEPLQAVVHLGDIIDYHNSVQEPEEESELSPSEAALNDVLAHFDRLPCPVLHLLGNHCLYNAPRHVLNERLGISRHQHQQHVQHSYYSFRPAPGWRMIALDGYDVSILGWPEGHPLHEQARRTLEAHNPNENWNSAAGLEGVARRFVKFGGGLSDEQLRWLEAQLAECRAAGERAILLCHLCFHPATCAPACLQWNYDQVLSLAHAYPDVVAATLAGHAHRDGYHCDEAGIHHRVCKAVLETPPGRDCFGVVEVHEDRIVVHGVDTFASGDWPLRLRGSSAGCSTTAAAAGAPAMAAEDGPASTAAAATAVAARS